MMPSPIPNGGDPRAAASFRPFAHHLPSKTMEEVWKDIDLHEITVPQPNPASCSAVTSSSPTSLILRDFLHHPSAAPPPSAAVLSPNSGSEFYFPADIRPGGHREGIHPFDSLASSVLSSFGKKRLPEGGNCDRRYKRMMKNRESAARSRARKQAYMNGLQLKICLLKEENDKLREQHSKLMLIHAEPLVQLPQKRLLQRTSTAPF